MPVQGVRLGVYGIRAFCLSNVRSQCPAHNMRLGYTVSYSDVRSRYPTHNIRLGYAVS